MPRVKWCYLLLHITPIEEPLGAQGRAHVFFAKMSGGGGDHISTFVCVGL